MALLIDEPVLPTNIRLMMQVEPTGPDIFANYAIPPRAALPKKKPQFEMLLPFDDLRETNTAETLFNNWFQKEKILRPVYDLLLSTVYRPGPYVQSTFLSLAQALESFHRKVYEGKYLTEKELFLSRTRFRQDPTRARRTDAVNTDAALTKHLAKEGILAKHNRSPRPRRSQSTSTADRPKRTAIYARVSTNGQRTEWQLSDLRAYAQARNLEVTEYVDHGHIGASERRPALDRLMNDARKRRLDCVLVWRFDRFARSTKHLLLALEVFRSLGIKALP